MVRRGRPACLPENNNNLPENNIKCRSICFTTARRDAAPNEGIIQQSLSKKHADDADLRAFWTLSTYKILFFCSGFGFFNFFGILFENIFR